MLDDLVVSMLTVIVQISALGDSFILKVLLCLQHSDLSTQHSDSVMVSTQHSDSALVST